jgi:predicted phosphodiesterase
MARLGVLSDIHGNLAALTRTLEVLDDAGVDGLLCLGDLVGYHPDGDACVEILARRGATSIAGNHDLIAAGLLSSDRCGRKAEFALARARQDLSPATAAFLASLPRRCLIGERVLCIHGTVDDVCEYMTTPEQVRTCQRRAAELFPDARACLFGHTHVPAVFTVERGEVARTPATGTVALERPGATVLVNPGSVDAARRRGGRAEFAILDTARLELTFLETRYDDRRSERRARAAGYRRPRTRLVAEWLLEHARIGEDP